MSGVDAKHDCRMPVRQSRDALARGLTLSAEIIPPAIPCQSGKLARSSTNERRMAVLDTHVSAFLPITAAIVLLFGLGQGQLPVCNE